MSSSFKRLPIANLRAILPRFKRQVQLGMKRIAVTHYGEVVGFLVPLKDVAAGETEGWIGATEEMPLTKFRPQLTQCWEKLQSDLDCIYVTYHTRRAVAFVSPRLAVHLPIPISEASDRLLSLHLHDGS